MVIPKSYCIYVPNSQQRQDWVNRQILKNGLIVEMVRGYLPQEIEQAELELGIDTSMLKGMGSRCSYLSKYKLLKEIKDDVAWIMEDDFYLRPSWMGVIKTFVPPQEAYMLRLCAFNNRIQDDFLEYKQYGYNIYEGKSFSLLSFIVNRPAIDAIVEHLSKPADKTIDRHLKSLDIRYLNVSPNAVVQAAEMKSVRNEFDKL